MEQLSKTAKATIFGSLVQFQPAGHNFLPQQLIL
jgi:hypothetical protein